MRGLRITHRFTTKETSSFKQYLNEISQIAMFSSEEEEECSKKAHQGDKKALDELVRRNLRFVISIAKQYESPNVSLEDLVNEGNIGLIMAAEKFDTSKGFKFISYAVFYVRKMIHEYLDKNGRLVRLPSNKINGVIKMNQYISEMEQKLGRSVDFSEVIEEYGTEMSQDELSKLQSASLFSFESLDNPIASSHSGNDGSSQYDVMVNTQCEPADHLVADSDVKKRVADILETLKPRDRKIMIALFGLNGNTPQSLKEVSEDVGLTREMVRQIREKSLRQLKNVFVN